MKPRAPRNQTITLSAQEQDHLADGLLVLDRPAGLQQILNHIICQDINTAAAYLPEGFADLLFLDPPYNLNKTFNETKFAKRTQLDYLALLEAWILPLLRLLKPTASVYLCSDWNACGAAQFFLEKHLIIRNRITWEREKGRGAKANWKNCSEDIWFCTVSNNYTFNPDAVKLKRKVIAPYTHNNGKPKDWQQETQGDFRLTAASNLWTDLTVPFWSMPENTVHPTQKPEKLLAKIILASTNTGDVILDPFAGSGSTCTAAKKLGRNYIGIEIDKTYACLAEKRIQLADSDPAIQGYRDGVFWERNTMPANARNSKK